MAKTEPLPAGAATLAKVAHGVLCMFNPWTSSIKDAETESERWKAAGGVLGDPLHPYSQFLAAANISAARHYIEDRSDVGGFNVLSAIRDCVTHGLVAPDWLAYAFNRRFDAVLNCRAGSWDDPQAFGRPYPKGTHLAALRKARLNRHAVLNAVNEALSREPDTPIDRALFEAVGKPLGLGATLASRLYYETRREPPPRIEDRAGRRRSSLAKSRKLAGRQRRSR